MHRAVEDVRLKQTLLNRKRERGDNMVNFNVGDYVLRSRVDEKVQIKLFVTWVGPYVVTAALPYSAFKLKHLVTSDELEGHASRLKFFADKDLDVTEEPLEHVTTQGIVLRVRELRKRRWNEWNKSYELLVGWHGLEPIEDSWEPLTGMYKDVSTLVQNYVAASKDPKLERHVKALDAKRQQCYAICRL
ncbi:hypothetical protein PC128_g8912 [Phytophthora cactorum]|nr:hypothetical protein PC128_g8912 [Phytophthora cactorum]